jgi:hypothetical protein
VQTAVAISISLEAIDRDIHHHDSCSTILSSGNEHEKCFAVCILILILSVAIMDDGISSSILILKNSMRVQHTSFSFSVEMSGGCPC